MVLNLHPTFYGVFKTLCLNKLQLFSFDAHLWKFENSLILCLNRMRPKPQIAVSPSRDPESRVAPGQQHQATRLLHFAFITFPAIKSRRT